MALETLKDVKELGGFKVVVMDELRVLHPEKFNPSGGMDYEWFEKEVRPFNFIYIRHDVNSLSFKLQDGPIGEKGVNGCQVDQIIDAAKHILQGLNSKFPCRENSIAITHLEDALHWLDHRTRDRKLRNVEGSSAV